MAAERVYICETEEIRMIQFRNMATGNMAHFRLIALFVAVVFFCNTTVVSGEIEVNDRGIIDAITNGVEGIVASIIDKVQNIVNSSGLHTLVETIEEKIEIIVASLRKRIEHLKEQIKCDIESAAEIMDEKIKPCIQEHSILVQEIETRAIEGFKECVNEAKWKIVEAKNVVENLLKKLFQVKQQILDIKTTCQQAGGIVDVTKCVVQGLRTLTANLVELSVQIAKSVKELENTGRNAIKEAIACCVKVQLGAIKDLYVVKNNILNCIAT